MSIKRDPCTPPPMIGKIGPYTVFVTPPSTPTPVFDSHKKVMVQPPPQQLDKSFVSSYSDGSVLGFFKNAASKVQNGILFPPTTHEKWVFEFLSYFSILFIINRKKKHWC